MKSDGSRKPSIVWVQPRTKTFMWAPIWVKQGRRRRTRRTRILPLRRRRKRARVSIWRNWDLYCYIIWQLYVLVDGDLWLSRHIHSSRTIPPLWMFWIIFWRSIQSVFKQSSCTISCIWRRRALSLRTIIWSTVSIHFLEGLTLEWNYKERLLELFPRSRFVKNWDWNMCIGDMERRIRIRI